MQNKELCFYMGMLPGTPNVAVNSVTNVNNNNKIIYSLKKRGC